MKNNNEFDIKTEIKLKKAFSKIFKEQSDEPKELPKEDIIYPDIANVCAIILKTDRIKKVFAKFIDVESIPQKNLVKNLDYKINEKFDFEVASRYDINYLIKILKCFEAIKTNPKIKMRRDYPLYLESEDFDFILAPQMMD